MNDVISETFTTDGMVFSWTYNTSAEVSTQRYSSYPV